MFLVFALRGHFAQGEDFIILLTQADTAHMASPQVQGLGHHPPQPHHQRTAHKYTAGCCWSCREAVHKAANKRGHISTPLPAEGRLEDKDTTQMLWTLPLIGSCVHVCTEGTRQRCQRAYPDKPPFRSTSSMDMAVSWGKRLCTLCHDRLPHACKACKSSVASAPAHFVPRRRITCAAMAPQDPPRARTAKPWPDQASSALALQWRKQRARELHSTA